MRVVLSRIDWHAYIQNLVALEDKKGHNLLYSSNFRYLKTALKINVLYSKSIFGIEIAFKLYRL